MINKNKDQGLTQQDCSYLTFNVVDWIDVFIRPTYKQIIVEALNYCIGWPGPRMDRGWP
jgi:hypothetical protein